MATTYYVDPNQSYASTASNAGTSSGAAWGSAMGGGWQRALAAVAAGDTIKVRSDAQSLLKSGNLGLWKLTYGTLTGTIIAGDSVIMSTDTSGTPVANATGVVTYHDTTGKNVYIESTGSAAWATGTRYIYKSAGNYAGTISASSVSNASPFAITSGTAAAPITIQSCDASWNPTTTRAVINGGSGTNYCLWISGNPQCDYYVINSIAATAASQTGFYSNSTNVGTCVWNNCAAYSNGGSGLQTAVHDRVIGGEFYSNSIHGINTGNTVAWIEGATCYSNGAAYGGINCGSSTMITNCVIRGNGYGIVVPSGAHSVRVVSNVIDGNSRDGIQVVSTSRGAVVIENRITNNGTSTSYYGINCDAIDRRLYEDRNVFYGNGTDSGATATHDTLNVLSGGNSLHAASTTEQGYTNAAAYNYTLTTAAIGRRFAVTVGSTTFYLTAGPGANDYALPAASKVYGGTDRGDGTLGTLRASTIATAAGSGENLSADLLLTGHTVDDVAGNIVLPAAAKVWHDAGGFGAGGATTPIMTAANVPVTRPAAGFLDSGDLHYGVQVDGLLTGTRKYPARADVRLNVEMG